MNTAAMPITSQAVSERTLRKTRSICALLDPEWRYTRAKTLRTEGVRRFARSEDPWIVAFTLFLRRYSAADSREMRRLEQKHPDIMFAYKIHNMQERGPRYHLEALVLVGKPVDEIASYLSLPDEVILAYECLFFDIRQHLDSPEAIRTYVASKINARGIRDLDPDSFWKRVALAPNGEELLYAVWDYGVLEESDRNSLDALIASDMRRNAVRALQVRSVDPYNAHEIVEEYLAMRSVETANKKVDAELDAGGSKEHEFAAALVRAIQFKVAMVEQASDVSCIELSAAVANAPALLERMQGKALEAETIDVPEQSSE